MPVNSYTTNNEKDSILVSYSFIPMLITSVGAGVVFGIFALMMVGQLIWVKLKMPETKGKTLEEVSKELTGQWS